MALMLLMLFSCEALKPFFWQMFGLCGLDILLEIYLNLSHGAQSAL